MLGSGPFLGPNSLILQGLVFFLSNYVTDLQELD